MTTEIRADGTVVAPLNIQNPAPSLNLAGFKWAGAANSLNSGPPGPRGPGGPGGPGGLIRQGGPHGRPDSPHRGPGPGPGPTPEPEAPLEHLDEQLEDQLREPGGPGSNPDANLPFPLEQFKGAYAGNGFNLIWRPSFFGRDSEPTITQSGADDNVLELNLTTEQMTFGPTLGSIPNRGFGAQRDIFLGGLPYFQTVQKVENPVSGKPDLPKTTLGSGIHFEPGVWLSVPAAEDTFQKGKPASIVRIASIPHGTTINAQGFIPPKNPNTVLGGNPGGPDLVKHQADSTPFVLGGDTNPPVRPVPFPSMNAQVVNQFRLPQDLTRFNESATGSGRITTEIIKNPNKVLENAIKGQNITETITFEVSTGLPAAELNGGGTSNIAFLAGAQAQITSQSPGAADMPNAHAAFMKSRFWIERVEYKVNIPVMCPNDSVDLLADMPTSTAPTPQFSIKAPPTGVPEPKTVKVFGIQIQYSQTVNLNFGPRGTILTWPHISVATLVPVAPQPWQLTGNEP